MANTRIDLAQDGLKALLVARAGLSGIPVDLGWPTRQGEGPAPEHVWISGDVVDWTREALTTGAGSRARDERFTLPIKVLVRQATDDYAEVRNRALALVDEITAAVESDTSLGGAVTDCDLMSGSVEESLVDDGRQLGITLNVACLFVA